jgi:hypothetical protein
MSFIAAAAIVGGASLASAYMGAKAAKSGANRIADSTAYAADIQKEMYEQGREDLGPYRELGYTALKDIGGMKPFLTGQFENYKDQYLDPSMAFRMKLGTQATERLSNVGGGALSGNTLRSLTDYGQNLASTEYTNAFNRFQTERGNIYNTLANIAGMGQGAVNTGVQAGQVAAQNQGQLAVGGAQALAAGGIGAANAYSNALGNVSDFATLAALKSYKPA